MSVNIKNREVEALLAELKRATGLGMSRIVLDLLRREVERVRRQRAIGLRRRRLQKLAERYSARLRRKPATPDEIVGYDERGLPE